MEDSSFSSVFSPLSPLILLFSPFLCMTSPLSVTSQLRFASALKPSLVPNNIKTCCSLRSFDFCTNFRDPVLSVQSCPDLWSSKTIFIVINWGNIIIFYCLSTSISLFSKLCYWAANSVENKEIKQTFPLVFFLKSKGLKCLISLQDCSFMLSIDKFKKYN